VQSVLLDPGCEDVESAVQKVLQARPDLTDDEAEVLVIGASTAAQLVSCVAADHFVAARASATGSRDEAQELEADLVRWQAGLPDRTVTAPDAPQHSNGQENAPTVDRQATVPLHDARQLVVGPAPPRQRFLSFVPMKPQCFRAATQSEARRSSPRPSTNAPPSDEDLQDVEPNTPPPSGFAKLSAPAAGGVCPGGNIWDDLAVIDDQMGEAEFSDFPAVEELFAGETLDVDLAMM
jgi:hypothetical protein